MTCGGNITDYWRIR